MIFNAGLILINIAWVVQLYLVVAKKDFKINPPFPLMYGAGCVLLVTGNFIDGEIATGVLNLICLLVVVALIAVLLTAKTSR